MAVLRWYQILCYNCTISFDKKSFERERESVGGGGLKKKLLFIINFVTFFLLCDVKDINFDLTIAM